MKKGFKMFKRRKPLSMGAFWILICSAAAAWILLWGWWI